MEKVITIINILQAVSLIVGLFILFPAILSFFGYDSEVKFKHLIIVASIFIILEIIKIIIQ